MNSLRNTATAIWLVQTDPSYLESLEKRRVAESRSSIVHVGGAILNATS
jgi:hypothetical protein